MKTYALCGSRRFAKEMQEIAYWLVTKKGFNVLPCIFGAGTEAPTEEELARLQKAHRRRMDLSDGIYVVNLDGYIGEAVASEIVYAKTCGKEILYHCQVEE